MTVTTAASRVIGGVDTHADTIHVAAIDGLGRDLGDGEFPTTPQGYRDAIAFLVALGDLAVIGIGGTSSYGAAITRAALAAGCGTAPVSASSGKATRHRLSRGGDRAANWALHTIALVRMSSEPRTRAFVAAQRDKGREDTEIPRVLKRAIAREVFKSLTRGLVAPCLNDLRPTRQTKDITLTDAARALGTYASKLLRTERGTCPDYELADPYREWLKAA